MDMLESPVSVPVSPHASAKASYTDKYESSSKIHQGQCIKGNERTEPIFFRTSKDGRCGGVGGGEGE